MLTYCTPEEAKSLTKMAGRFDQALVDAVEAATVNCNTYIRRNLEYGVGIVEYHTVPSLKRYEKINLWLEKRPIDPDSLVVMFNRFRDFTDIDASTLPGAQWRLDPYLGKLTIYGMLCGGLDGVRVSYNGGYPARSGDDSTAMDCPASLRQACAMQAVYDIDRRANLFGGTNEATDKGKGTMIKVGAFGLLQTTMDAFSGFRKPLGE